MYRLACYQLKCAAPDMNAFTDYIKRRLLLLLVLHVFASLSISVKYEHNAPNINAKTRIPLRPITLPCYLNEMVRLAAPMINEEDLYFLSKPDGSTMKLNLSWSKDIKPKNSQYPEYRDGTISVKYIKNTNAIINQESVYSIFTTFEYNNQLDASDLNEYIIGPLLEEDYGNWVLSVFTKDLDDEWVELFQVITIEITTVTLLEPPMPSLIVGDTFNLSFAYPFPNIETCEITAPSTTSDRFFTRNTIDFNKCSFSIPNITMEDAGLWKITAVGRIKYEGEVTLKVFDPKVIKEKVKRLLITRASSENNV